MITLEKIDQIVERTGVSYSKAREALENSNGDVIEAIILLEKSSKSSNFTNSFNLKKDEVVQTLRDLIKKGNVTKVIVEKDGKRYLEIPVNIAISAGAISLYIGTILIPVIAVLGVGMFIGNFKIKVVNDDGSEVDVNEETHKRILLLKGKIENKKEETKEKQSETTQDDELIDLNLNGYQEDDDK